MTRPQVKKAVQSPYIQAMTPAQIEQFFAILQQDNPSPTTELIFKNPFELLIAVILSAQATDKSVNKATTHLFAVADCPRQMVQLGVEGIKQYIRHIGLFNVKAENIYKTCMILETQYAGQIPASRQSLEALPGVGRKTANVVLNTAFHQPTMAVDTHIFRVANRTGLAIAPTVLGVEKRLLTVIPSQYLLNAHHWLILLGRYVCVARNPRCAVCLVRQYCQFDAKSI